MKDWMIVVVCCVGLIAGITGIAFCVAEHIESTAQEQTRDERMKQIDEAVEEHKRLNQ